MDDEYKSDPLNIYTDLKAQSFDHNLQQSECVWLSTLTWQIRMSIMVNAIISLDTKYFSSRLVQTRGKYDLFLF